MAAANGAGTGRAWTALPWPGYRDNESGGMLAEATNTSSIVIWSLLLIGLIVAGWLTVWQVRRRLQRDDLTANAGFTLSDLRQLHKAGKMTDEEFDRAKARVVDAARKAAARDAARQAGAGSDPGVGKRGP